PELARSLKVDLGDEVNVVTPEGDMGPTGKMPQSRPFQIVGIFHTGMYEYDSNYAYTSFEDAAHFLNRDGATGVEVKTVDPDEALEIADEMQAELGSDYEVLDWQEMNRSLFFALELEKIAMFVVLTFIILVASFSIIAMLIMIVIEKSRDIAVLRSMGVTDRGVRRIFELQGLVIGAVGAAIGLALGLGICTYMSVYGLPLDSEVYYISTLPVDVNPLEVGAVVICALVISWAATVYPAHLAANLKPVDGLRYD
ncbi:MAG: FtsX-like permease family protein, partial [Persicimonas sp.]